MRQSIESQESILCRIVQNIEERIGSQESISSMFVQDKELLQECRLRRRRCPAAVRQAHLPDHCIPWEERRSRLPCKAALCSAVLCRGCGFTHEISYEFQSSIGIMGFWCTPCSILYGAHLSQLVAFVAPVGRLAPERAPQRHGAFASLRRCGLCVHAKRPTLFRGCIEDVPSQIRRKKPLESEKRYRLDLGPDAHEAKPVPVQSMSFWNLPNALTLARLILLPPIVVFFYISQRWAALVCTTLFGMVSLTDWLDGYIARRLNVSSVWGAFLDPVADKLSVATMLILLVERYARFWVTLPAVVILVREIAITALREWMASRGLRDVVAVNQHGKLKTVFQMGSIMLLLLAQPSIGLPPPVLYLGVSFLHAAAVLSLVSGYRYFRAALEAHATYY